MYFRDPEFLEDVPEHLLPIFLDQDDENRVHGDSMHLMSAPAKVALPISDPIAECFFGARSGLCRPKVWIWRNE